MFMSIMEGEVNHNIEGKEKGRGGHDFETIVLFWSAGSMVATRCFRAVEFLAVTIDDPSKSQHHAREDNRRNFVSMQDFVDLQDKAGQKGQRSDTR